MKPLPNYVKDVINVLRSNGFKAYIVGGAVRDLLLGLEPNDYDVATNAKPDEVLAIFKEAGYITVPKGIQYGVVSVIHPATRKEVEIATFRKEYYPLDYDRKNVKVEYADTILDDLARRDFTINALALSPSEGVVDPHGGLNDLRGKVIRFVGNPNERIREDPLRMLRAVRFASKLGFTIHPSTMEAIRRNAGKLRRISRERVGMEVLKAMKGVKPWLFPKLLLESRLHETVLPQLSRMATTHHDRRLGHHGESVLEHTMEAMQRLSKVSKKPELMLACMLHDIGKPEVTTVKNGKTMFPNHEKVGAETARHIVLKEWRLPSALAKYVATVIRHHMLPIYLRNAGLSDEKIIAKLLTKLPTNIALDVLIHAYADTGDKHYLKLAKQLKELASRKQGQAVKPVINGHDIMKIYGLRPGPAIGQIKRKLYEIQVTHRLTRKEDIIRKACEEGVICPPTKREKEHALRTG